MRNVRATFRALNTTPTAWPWSTWATARAVEPRRVGAASATRAGSRGRTRPDWRQPIELNDRIFVGLGNREVERTDKYEALAFEIKFLDEEPEGTLVKVRVEFSDADSWWFRSMRVGDTVFCEPDAATKYGMDASTIIRSMGVTFSNEVP